MKRPTPRCRKLTVENLEQRWLLASLASRLPPIRLDSVEAPVGMDTVRIVDRSGQSSALSQAGLDGIRRLQLLNQQVAETTAEGGEILSRLQQASWNRIAEWSVVADATPLAAEQAIAIAEAGFEAHTDAGRFGPALSTRLGEPLHVVPSTSQPKLVDSDAFDTTSDLVLIRGHHDAVSVTVTTPDQSSPDQSRLVPGVTMAVDRALDPNLVEADDAVDGERAETDRRNAERPSSPLKLPRAAASESDDRHGESIVNDEMVELDVLRLETRGTAESYKLEVIDAAVDPQWWQPSRQANGPSDLLSKMIWLPLDVRIGEANDRQAGAVAQTHATISPFALLQLFAGGNDQVDGGRPLEFSPITNETLPTQQLATSWSIDPQRWSASAVTLLLLAGYWYQRRLRHPTGETDERVISPSI